MIYVASVLGLEIHHSNMITLQEHGGWSKTKIK